MRMLEPTVLDPVEPARNRKRGKVAAVGFFFLKTFSA
jgi:hypothetical protein